MTRLEVRQLAAARKLTIAYQRKLGRYPTSEQFWDALCAGHSRIHRDPDPCAALAREVAHLGTLDFTPPWRRGEAA